MPYQPLTNEDSPLSAYPPYPFPQETFEVQQPAPQQQQQAQQQTQQKGTASECGRGNVVAIALFLLFSFGIIALIFHAAANTQPIPRLQFVGEHDYVLAEDGSLTEKLTITQSGQYIHVYCNATELANRFCLDLKGHEASKFKFCADFTNETDRGAHSYIEILRKDGKYVKEQIVNPFERNSTVDLRIRFTEKYVQVFGNQGELGIYNRPAGLEVDLTGTLSGDLGGVRLFRVEGHSYTTPFENALQFERGDRLDLALQPMVEVRDEAQIRAIFGQQNQPGAAPLRKKRKSSTTSKRGESGNRTEPLAQKTPSAPPMSVENIPNEVTKTIQIPRSSIPLQKGSSSHSRGGSAARAGGRNSTIQIPSSSIPLQKGSSSHSRGGSAARARNSTTPSPNPIIPYPNKAGSTPSPNPPAPIAPPRPQYFSHIYARYRLTPRRMGPGKSFYAEKPTSNRTTSLLKPYSGPASFSYRHGGRSYFMPSTSCCGDEFHGKTVDIPKPKNVNVTFTDGDGAPSFIISLQFSKDSLWMNAWEKPANSEIKGRWNPDRLLKTNDMPIDDWRIFDLSIRYTSSDLLIYFNGQRFADFDHREHNLKLDKMRIEGDVEILAVTKNGKTL